MSDFVFEDIPMILFGNLPNLASCAIVLTFAVLGIRIIENNPSQINSVIGTTDAKFIQRSCEQGQADCSQELRLYRNKDIPAAQVCRSRQYRFSGSAIDQDKVIRLAHLCEEPGEQVGFFCRVLQRPRQFQTRWQEMK